MIRTLIAVTYFCLALVLIMPWLILYSWLRGNAALMYRFAMGAIRIANWMVGIRVRVEGLEKIPSGVCIFASNHLSNVDPVALVPAIPRQIALLVKKELFRVPLLSTAMLQAKFVPVDRADREAAVASVDKAVLYLKDGLSFAVFPEGTRSRDGHLRPFKKGTFVMAIQAGVPIVPVCLIGAQKLMRKGSRALYPGEVIVRFLPPVDASQYTFEQRGELLSRVEKLVADALPPEQQPLPV
ncbi:MAG TPA: lysophospholipid acyltransferase family protein [Candidatus Acidoferrales bacterium]|nr:lysophospholipid acyltransferase family protein [Candidatus Acidoferrales bacterium]